MSVELWYGQKPDHEAEQLALMELYRFLAAKDEHFLVLSHFHAGPSNEIDLVILKRQAIFIADLKSVRSKIVGEKEGDWRVVRDDGSEYLLNPGRPNPYKQVCRGYYAFRDWLVDHQAEILDSEHRRQVVDLGKMLSFVVAYPFLHPESQVSIGDFPVRLCGFDEFLLAVEMRTRRGFDLTREEMQRIPMLLKLTPWEAEKSAAPPQDTVPLPAAWRPPSVCRLVARGDDYHPQAFDIGGKEMITIGRDPQNDLVIDDPSVSRYHARIRKEWGRYVVYDLGSKNGTFVNFKGLPTEDERRVTDRNALQNHSTVRFGRAGYTFLLEQ